MGDEFNAADGKVRVRISLGSEECLGGGNTETEARQAAAMQVRADLWSQCWSGFHSAIADGQLSRFLFLLAFRRL